MTNQEFSDTFTTMLNSYNTQAQFGEQASKREIVLDEYEKSVLLTQAQDIVIKSYFDGSLNQQGQGFDDSTRRQMDFSSLIKVAELTPASTGVPFDDRGIVYQLPRKKIDTANQKLNAPAGTYISIDGDSTHVLVSETTDVLFILNEKLTAKTIKSITESYWHKEGETDVVGDYDDSVAATLPTSAEWKDAHQGDIPYGNCSDAEDDEWTWIAGTITYNNNGKGKEYVIVPISYKEYDREMSKPYAQPLKKQAWRLFQNMAAGFDINSELIPRWNIVRTGTPAAVGDTEFIYKIRYVKRPRPIILEDLPNELEIDGETKSSSCELNPIIHIDILNKAVELAIATRGGSPASNK